MLYRASFGRVLRLATSARPTGFSSVAYTPGLGCNSTFRYTQSAQRTCRFVGSKASASGTFGSSGGGKAGGNGGAGKGGKGGSGGSRDDGMSNFSVAALCAAYMRLMDSNPFLTKVVTSAALNGIGDICGQVMFERGKPFDWSRLAKFTFLGGALVAPVLGFWYHRLNILIPGANTAGALGRLFLDQALFAPCFVALFLSSLLCLNGTPQLIIPKLKQDLFNTVTANWALWLPGQFINFRYVAPQYNLLFSNMIALVWSTYLSWAGSRKVQQQPSTPVKPSRK